MKHALMVGINYFGQDGELRGCQEDVKNMKEWLETLGYTDIVLLQDNRMDKKHTNQLAPTKDNILRELQAIVSRCKAGDSLLVHYSGHGSQLKSTNPKNERDGKDETLCPVDYSYAKLDNGFIRDNQLQDILVKGLPDGVKLRMVCDSCHSGSILDLPEMFYEYTCINETSNKSEKDVICISGCRDSQTSADATIGGSAQGAMTWSLLKALSEAKEKGEKPTWKDLIKQMRKDLKASRYSQVPQLSCNKESHLDSLVDLL